MVRLDAATILPAPLRELLETCPALRDAWLVGGCVRDALLGRPLEDFDIEVHGVSLDALIEALAPHGGTDLVGKSFGVVKLTLPGPLVIDFSVPRRDSKVAPGHRGFEVAFDPTLSPREAAARRDFTINAMMWNPRQGELLDAFGGLADLEARVLRHTSPAFIEDPLRVLRGMQFVSRFGLTAAPETVALCRTMREQHAELSLDRVRDEWLKWATRARVPSAGLAFLADCGWLVEYPELAALVGTPQDSEWHPEGDVFTHTGHALDALVALPEWQRADAAARAVLSFAVLTHDLGKATTTRHDMRDGRERVTSPGHELASAPLAESLLARMGVPSAIVAHVLPLVANHMVHLQTSSDRAVRRLARRLAPSNIETLAIVIEADASGRPPRPGGRPTELGPWLERAQALHVEQSAPRPLLLGRHVVARGLDPGPRVGEWLAAAYDAQLEGAFSDITGALAWLESRLPRATPPSETAARPAPPPGGRHHDA